MQLSTKVLPISRRGIAWGAAFALLAGPTVYAPIPAQAATKKPAAKKSSPITANPGAIELGPGEVDILEIKLANPYGHPTVGSLRLEPGPDVTLEKQSWDGPLPAWGAKFYTKVKAKRTTNRATSIKVHYYVDRAGEFTKELPVKIKIPLKIEVVPDYEGKAVRVRATNLLSDRVERGRVELKSYDRLLQDKVSAILPPIQPGETKEVSIPVLTQGIAPGMDYRFDATVQTWAGYQATFSHKLMFYGQRK